MADTSELIVSVSGIRGIIGQGLSPGAAGLFAAALGTYVHGGKVVLSRDSRPSGDVLRHAVLAGLMASGCEVVDIGIAPTPTLGVAVPRLDAAGALQITASHNPAEWNGLKLFGGEGAVLDASRGRVVKEIYDARRFREVAWNQLGRVSKCGDPERWHRERVLQLVDAPLIRSRSLRVLLDANGGAGGSLGEALLESFESRPVVIGGDLDGAFAHPPEPLAENLVSILSKVPAAGADIGFVLDPDADRLAIIDETGRYIGEELTLALAVQCRLAGERGPIVINMSTSRVVEDLARQAGVPCHRSAVGEANVVARMREVDALIGGEGNGGVIDPRVGWVRDPFIGMGLILNLMADTGKKVSELVAALPQYAIVKDKIALPRERLAGLDKTLQERWPDADLNLLDGVRLGWDRSWLHVRPSNTEPVVRIIAEAPRREDAERLCQEAAAALLT